MLRKTHQTNEILFVTSYPPRECGIATYSTDLIEVINRKFKDSFSVSVCAIEEDETQRNYPDEVKYHLNSSDPSSYLELAGKINTDETVKLIFIQHEFGLHGGEFGQHLLPFLYSLNKPVLTTFHTVLPKPEKKRKKIVRAIANASETVVVMTKRSASLLKRDYDIPESKVSLIPHGTHIVPWRNKQKVKKKHGLADRLVLTTFGLLSANKSIETALDALPDIVRKFPKVLYLILGKTHPAVVKNDGEVYRKSLELKVKKLNLQDHVFFVDKYLELGELLEYLLLTDIYLFTSKDPHQAVSGTFAYAMSCACPVISTPIPHAQEMLSDNAGILFGFSNSIQLKNALIKLLADNDLREEMGRNAFHQTRTTLWENTAISHAKIFKKGVQSDEALTFNPPEINLDHIYALTNNLGMIQFSNISEPDVRSGFTLDDNARAMIAMCMHYENTRDNADLDLIETYLNFIEYCQQPNGKFLNYVDVHKEFHLRNSGENLEDSNGRAIWALGVLMKHSSILPIHLVRKSHAILAKSILSISEMGSPRALAFVIKGLYFYYQATGNNRIRDLIDVLADGLLDKYNQVADTNWKWFEEYLTYANSTLPEAMLYAYLATNKGSYKIIAHVTFEFLLSHLFIDGTIRVISNKGWYKKGKTPNRFGEQPIDVSYTIQALYLFYKIFKDEAYMDKLNIALSWFAGNNHLGQIVYNPVTGGCYDGLEEYSVNLNQGAESTVCYLIARLTWEKANEEAVPEKILAGPLKKLVEGTIHPVTKRLAKQKKHRIELR